MTKLRVVAGRHRGRRLATLAGRSVRPTADRVREALFNLLAHNDYGGAALPGDVNVVDAFAGSGALGLEALSRGAAHVSFIDNDEAALDVVRRNVEMLGERDRAAILRIDALHPGRARLRCRLALLDPPYGSGLAAPALVALKRATWFDDGAVCVVEVAAKELFEPPTDFAVLDERRYGAARLVVLATDPKA